MVYALVKKKKNKLDLLTILLTILLTQHVPQREGITRNINIHLS